jgi:16S rRNA C967 or C1407 C5-methylase (RsmB/RsmF family)/NOL1/NOP2/fmu family ribosome biogenesis protein
MTFSQLVFVVHSPYLAGKYQKKTQKIIEKTSEILPQAFLERIKKQFPVDYEAFIESIDQPAAVSLRINPRKFHLQVSAEKVPWCETGFFLNERPSFTLDPIFHSGAYYVQEASSMFVEQAFRQMEAGDNRIVLDLCAAPGGKSTHLLSLLGTSDLLVSNEVIRSRVSVLDENIRKWGHQNVVVCSNDPADFSSLEGLFDVILVDAPCSGEGLFRRDASAIQQWSVDNTNLCATRQRRILADIWPSLKSGGYLIYSTCTFNTAENEENLKWLAENNEVESIRIQFQESWGVQEMETNGLFDYRFLPHKVKGEGFFLTLIRKKEGPHSYSIPKKTRLKLEKMPKQFAEIRNWLTTENSEFFAKSEFLIAFPEDKIPVLNALAEQLRVISFGLPVAQFKKNDLLPEHTFALSVDRNPAIFETFELNLRDALLFQKKEEIRIDSATKGWLLVSFKGVPLGFVKNLGNRANNYFPKEWRIRMALPELPERGIYKIVTGCGFSKFSAINQ